MKPTIEIPKIKTETEISLRVVGLIVALPSNLFSRYYEDSSRRFFSNLLRCLL
jgi:hypothetical protein